MPFTPAEFEFYVRNPRTLAFVGELRPQDVAARWTRRDVAGGSFEVTIPRDLVSLSLLDAHNLIEIRRDGAQEFVGVLERREIDRLGKQWKLSGPDTLGWWLEQRRVGATAADDRAGGAEDVLVAYLNAYLGNAAAAAQRAQNALSGTTWSVQASSGRGAAVNIASGRRTLAAVVEEICREGDLVPSLVLLDDLSGYELRVAAPTDATSASGAVPFAVDWDNVEELIYAEDYRTFWNYLYVFGEGAGDSRPYSEVADVDSVATHFRREGAIDARYATTADQRQAVGDLEIVRRQQALVTVRAKPFRAAGSARYREDWDVGWDVTFGESELRSEPVDIRVVSATIALTRERGEDITFELGQHRAGSQLRRLEDAVRQLRVASLE